MPLAVCIDHDIILSTVDQLAAYDTYAVSTQGGLL